MKELKNVYTTRVNVQVTAAQQNLDAAQSSLAEIRQKVIIEVDHHAFKFQFKSIQQSCYQLLLFCGVLDTSIAAVEDRWYVQETFLNSYKSEIKIYTNLGFVKPW